MTKFTNSHCIYSYLNSFVSDICTYFLVFRHRTGKVNREVKDVVAFHAGDFVRVSQILQLDLHEPPVSQVREYFITSGKKSGPI